MTLQKADILKIPMLKEKDMSNLEVAKYLKVSRRTVDYWIKKLKKAGHKIKSKKPSGRPPIDLTK